MSLIHADTLQSTGPVLELDDIQSGVLRPRPSPYVGTYILLRIDEAIAGRELLRRARRLIKSAAETGVAESNTWLSVALTFHGLKAVGVPDDSLESFAPEFKQGMAARATLLGDVGESAPEAWEAPFGTRDVHVALAAVSPDSDTVNALLERARATYLQLSGVTALWRQDCHARADGKEAFGFRDGISHPAVEGSGIAGTNPNEPPLKAGEFVLGYPNESRVIAEMPRPEVLGRNGTYVAVRKLYQRVAAFRRYLRSNSSSAAEEEFLAAKMMGRWRSGAPLALSPLHDNPDLGADASRNNVFMYAADDPHGYNTPPGSHIRRANPRDASVSGVARIHRMIRRGTSYGPPLPADVLDDDGVDRGLIFTFIGASLSRQFEFVQSEWIDDGTFIGAGSARDPITGSNSGEGIFDIPRRPIRKRLSGLQRFVVTRGGEYFFMPGLRALEWLSELS